MAVPRALLLRKSPTFSKPLYFRNTLDRRPYPQNSKPSCCSCSSLRRADYQLCSLPLLRVSVVREKLPVEFWNERRRASSLPHASCAQGRRETLDDFCQK